MAGPAWATCTSPEVQSIASGASVTFGCNDSVGFKHTPDVAPSHGTLAFGGVPTNVYAVIYTNNGDGALSDTFVLYDYELSAPVTFNVTIGPAASPITVSPASLPAPAVGVAYIQSLSASGGTAPYTYSLGSGTIPPGISVSSTGVISGTSTASGPHTFTVNVSDSTTPTPITTSKSYSVTIAAPVLDLTPDAPDAGVAGVPYTLQFATSGGTAPYTYQVEGGLGTLPPGLSLSSSGLVSGTPTALGTYTFSLRHDDSTGSSTGGDHFRAQMVSITINNASPPDAPTIGTATAGDAQASIAFTAPADDGGSAITGYTVTSSPGNLTANGSASPITVTGLTNGTAYTFTVAATNGAGTGAASAPSNSVTPMAPIPVPAVTSIAPNTGSTIGGTAVLITGSDFAGATAVRFGAANATAFTIASATTITAIVPSGSAGSVDVTVTTAGGTSVSGASSRFTYIAAPVASPVSATVAHGSGANPITLNITGGTPTSVAIGTAASHGTAVASGTTITYQPDAGYVGPDSFTYSATNAGGISAPATVTITVSAPAAPTAAPKSVTTAYNTAAAIDLSGSITGVEITAVTIGTAPAHGTVSVSGKTVTYTPSSTYYGGSDSFAYTATNAGGTSAPATVTITVGTPAAPTAAAKSVTTAYNMAAAIDLSGSITGAGITAVTIAAAPSHGTAVASGTTITYQPDGSYVGPDAFTYTATNASGTSAPATVSITVSDPTLGLTPASGTLPLTYGAPDSQTFTASGGTSPYSYTLSGTLPDGLSFNATTGVLSGTPTQTGSYPVGVTATDSSTGSGAPFSITQSYTVEVAAPSIVLTPASLPAGSAGTAYPATSLSASGGAAAYSYAVTVGALPAGLALSSAGQLSGVPTAAGSFAFTVTATDAYGQTGSRAYILGIDVSSLTLSPATLANATAETAYSQTLTTSGGVAPYIYAITGGNLPTGVNLDANTGELTGTPTVSGDFNFTVTATDSSTGTGAPFSATQSYTLHVDAPVISLTPATLPDGTAGAAYPSTTLTASGGVGPYSYTLTGTVPAGMTFDAGTATLSGTPTAAGSFSLNAIATDTHGFTASMNYTLVIQAATLTLSPATLADATAETAYSQTLTTSGGVAPYSYASTGGALPAGLSLDASTGVIAGAPTVSGSFSVDVKVTDASTGAGAPASVMRTYALVVAAPVISITPASLPAAQQGAAYSQALTASGGDGSYSFTVTTGALPAGLSLAGNGLLAGTPTVSGSFGFTITASDGLNFTGTQAYTLAVGVAVPVAVDDSASTSANQPVTIAVTGNDSGPIASIAVASAPAHGTATVNGLDVVYTPATSFFGSDTLTYTATGAGGTSAPATVTITVTPLAVPTAVAHTVTTLAGTAVTIHATEGATGGPFTAVTLASAPASGTAIVSGEDIVYTSTVDAAGPVSFTYTLSNAFGVSPPATVTVQVNPVPQVAAQTVGALAGTTVQVELTRQATGGPFTGAELLSISPTSAGTGVIVKGVDGYRLDFAAAATYVGAAQVSFTLSNAYATSSAGIVTVNVTARPDPSKDAEVLGVLGAQVQAARRFATGQIGNFQQRLEHLHSSRGGTAGFDSGLSVASDQPCGDRDWQGVGSVCPRPLGDEQAPVRSPKAVGASPNAPSRLFGVWTSGAMRFGDYDPRRGASGFEFETSGVSLGADYHLAPDFALGGGLGYGRDVSDIGEHDSRSEADAWSAVVYASYHPGDHFYLDGLLGHQWLSFQLRRHVTANGAQVRGDRDGQQWFASLAAGYQWQREKWGVTPYARLDVAQATLDDYVEHGDPVYALAFAEQDIDTTTTSLGVRVDYLHELEWGTFAPQLRLEYQHDIEADSLAAIRYADLPMGPIYRAGIDGFDRDRLVIGLGAGWSTLNNFGLRLEYRSMLGNSGADDQAVTLQVEKKY